MQGIFLRVYLNRNFTPKDTVSGETDSKQLVSPADSMGNARTKRHFQDLTSRCHNFHD